MAYPIEVHFIGGPYDGSDTMHIASADSRDLREIFESLDVDDCPEGQYRPVSANTFFWFLKKKALPES